MKKLILFLSSILCANIAYGTEVTEKPSDSIMQLNMTKLIRCECSSCIGIKNAQNETYECVLTLFLEKNDDIIDYDKVHTQFNEEWKNKREKVIKAFGPCQAKTAIRDKAKKMEKMQEHKNEYDTSDDESN